MTEQVAVRAKLTTIYIVLYKHDSGINKRGRTLSGMSVDEATKTSPFLQLNNIWLFAHYDNHDRINEQIRSKQVYLLNCFHDLLDNPSILFFSMLRTMIVKVETKV
jgi:hypothetical protein